MVEAEPRYQPGVVAAPAHLKGKKCLVDTVGGLVYYGPVNECSMLNTDLPLDQFEGCLPFSQISVALDAGVEILRVREIEG